MADSPPSDALKNLGLFIIALAIIATIVALAWYFGIGVPAQMAGLHAPTNDCSGWRGC